MKNHDFSHEEVRRPGLWQRPVPCRWLLKVRAPLPSGAGGGHPAPLRVHGAPDLPLHAAGGGAIKRALAIRPHSAPC